MKYYIRTKKELNYELSEPFDTQKQAEEKFEHLHKKTKAKSSVISIPEIRNGLILYLNNGYYYKTICGSGKSLWFLKDNPKDDEIPDPMLKENLLNLFLTNKLLSVEEYYEDENVKFENIQDLGGIDTGLKEEDE